MRTKMRTSLVILLIGAVLLSTAYAAEEKKEGEGGGLGHDWASTHANADVDNKASLQRGARNFAQFCLGCHSMKYERWSRLGQDLDISPELLEKDLMPPGDKP